MELYEYVGRNQRGESMRGTIESNSAQAVAAWLTGSDISPVSIRPRQEHVRQTPPWLAKLIGENKVSHMDLLLFTRQMANMAKAGLQIIEAIDGIQKSTGSKALANVLRGVRDDLDRGVVLSAAFVRFPDVFDDYYVNMIRVGEGTGELQGAFDSLYRQLQFDRDLQQKMKTAMRYPTFVVLALGVALAVVTLFVIPAFARTYAMLKVELPLLTRVLLAISQFSVQYWWVILIGIGAVIYATKLLLQTEEGRYGWDKWKLRIPILGPLMKKATVARFSRSFATALKANVPIVTAFQLVTKVVENAFFEDRIQQMQKSVERGEVLSRAMRTAGIFSPLELQLISVGERTGEVERAVNEIAQLYTQDVEYEVERLSENLEPLLLLLMGLLVAGLLLGIFLPMWDLGQAYLKK